MIAFCNFEIFFCYFVSNVCDFFTKCRIYAFRNIRVPILSVDIYFLHT